MKLKRARSPVIALLAALVCFVVIYVIFRDPLVAALFAVVSYFVARRWWRTVRRALFP